MSDPANTAHDVEGTVALAVLVAFPLSALLGNAFWNRGTTIDVRITTVIVISGLAAFPVAARTLRHWFRRREKLDPPPHWNLKQDSPGTWALTGITSAALQAVSIAVAVYFLSSLLAQHSGGSQIRALARVAEVEHFTHRKAACKTRVRFSWNWGRNVRACIVPRFGRSLANRQVQVGDTALLIISSNVFGSALVGVELPESAQAAQQSAARDRAKSVAREQ